MEWEATDKQEEEIGVIHEVMDKSLRHQHEVMSSSVQIQWLQIFVDTSPGEYTHIDFLVLSSERD